MKIRFTILFVFIGFVALSQPNSYVFGPAFTTGAGKWENMAFSRKYSTDNTGTPVVEFDNLQTGKFGLRGVGLLGEVNKKHFHMGLDLAIPMKAKFKNIEGTVKHVNVFNIALAWGFFIKDKYGIMLGSSIFGTASGFEPDVNSFADSSASTTTYVNAYEMADHKSNGKFYLNKYSGGGLSLDFHFIYPITEQLIFRATYSPTYSPLKVPESVDGKHFKNDNKGSKKIETGLFYQINGKFGFFARYTHTRLNNAYYLDAENLGNNGTGNPGTPVPAGLQNLSIFPDQELRLHTFVLGCMIPMGWLFGGNEVQRTDVEFSVPK